MRVLVLGGYGVFGQRLAQLLRRDGHDLTIAGRNLASAKAVAAQLGCNALQLDRNGDISALFGHEVVIDAAGPFHAQGPDPYRFARAVLAAGAHYLDLSDNAEFCSGIIALDRQAKDAGLCALSGLSSVPGLSSAAVRALTGSEIPQIIDIAILPGNRSPRGLSVMTSILTQAGKPFSVWTAGRWAKAWGWSDPKTYRLPDGTMRQGWQIEVPDTRLFPRHFGASTVIFRAGLELSIMRYGLALFGLLRRRLPIRVTPFLVRAFQLAAGMFLPFGSARGGMSVMVVTATERHFWRLLAEQGDGPFIPGVAIRALLRRPSLPAGARPALEVITLDEAEAAMTDLKVRCERATEPRAPIIPQVLGPDFEMLPANVRALHLNAEVSTWQGSATVRRGSSRWGQFLAAAFGFPPEAEAVPVEVRKTVTDAGEIWFRKFGDHRFQSRIIRTQNGLTESFGPFAFRLAPFVREGALHFPVAAARMGPLPLPRWLLPGSDAREFDKDGTVRFDIRLTAPITARLIVHYTGQLSAVVPAIPFHPDAPDHPTLA